MTALVLVCALGAVLDRVEEMLEDEQFEQAYALLAQADENDPRFASFRARTISGVARTKQRRDGYGAAIEFLEPLADTPDLMKLYALTCTWAGEEQRGLDKIRRLPDAQRRQYAAAEIELLWSMHDFAALEKRARAIGDGAWAQSWVDYAKNARELRERFDARTRRGSWVAIGALLALTVAAFAFTRLCRAERTS
ncbi:MAG: hypothetical protein AAGD14_16515 [Planctomycetota bacterium]